MSPTLDPGQFVELRDLIYARIGMFFGDRKVPFIARRVEKRLGLLRMTSFSHYINHLRFCDPDGHEMQELTNLITTNETYMFREFEQLKVFANHCLPGVVRAKLACADRRLRIWSAGCSSGEEPYTLAIILQEVLDEPESWKLEILASDIDENVLERARQAVYGSRSVKDVPGPYLDRHFDECVEGYRVTRATRSLVTFSNLNLHESQTYRTHRGFDFIFCRNVLIYFDDASRRHAVESFYHSLNVGGYIFLGHSESLSRITDVFTLKRMADNLVYIKEDRR